MGPAWEGRSACTPAALCESPAAPDLPAPCLCPTPPTLCLTRRGFADSKTLSEEKRERLYEAIQQEGGVLGYEADVLSAAHISGAALV